MMLIRRFELTAQDVYRKGEMPGFIHLYVGEEATAVGVCAHLRRDDWITSTHRGHGHALAKGVPPRGGAGRTVRQGRRLLRRARRQHAPLQARVGLFGTNGFVGGGLPATVGLGLSARTRGTDQVAVAFFGDGAVNHGAFHESLNFAGVQKLPVVFVCENNLYATATPLSMATLNTEVATKAAAYGIPGVAVDGNDVLAVWEVARKAVERARAGRRPDADRSQDLSRRRPPRRRSAHRHLSHAGRTRRLEGPLPDRHVSARSCSPTGRATAEQLDDDRSRRSKPAMARGRRLRPSLAAPRSGRGQRPRVGRAVPSAASSRRRPAAETKVQTWLEAVRDGIAEEMRRDPHIIYFGEGTGERGGSFAHTKNCGTSSAPSA